MKIIRLRREADPNNCCRTFRRLTQSLTGVGLLSASPGDKLVGQCAGL